MSRSRIRLLEARRRLLIEACQEQRLELSYRIAQLRPSIQLTQWTRRGGPKAAASHPFTWIAGALGLLLMARPRKLLAGMGWLTGLVALASRATTLLRLFAQLRAAYAGSKASRRA